MDLEKGKQIFFKYDGSHFNIDTECPKEYKKCEIPKEIEQQWLEEIKDNFLKSIDVEKGSHRVALINRYIQLLDNTSAVYFLIEMLNKKDLDTFSMIILAESIKHYLSLNISDGLKEKINILLLQLKDVMLSGEIKIDECYKKAWYMKDYDFSTANIVKRINKL